MSQNNRYILLLFLGFIFLYACQSPNSAPYYYFPLPSPGDAYVYHYQAETEGFPDEYWLIKRIGVRQLRICIYDEFRGWNQCSYEYLAPSGIIQDSVLLFGRDGAKNRVEVVYGNLYPKAKLNPEMVFLQYLRWYHGQDSLTFTEVIRNRRILSSGESGENELTFHLLESIEDYQEGFLSIEAEGREVFERGKGLVFFTKEIGEVVRTYTLKEQLSVESFEKKTGKSLPSF